MKNIRAHIYVSGIVQGVFFRSNALRKAVQLGVTGWVKNLSDGRVEIIVEGKDDLVNQMLAWCRNGPKGAVVKDIDFEISPYKKEFIDFRVTY